MANTFVKIQTVTVGASGAATIDFTSIPQTFTDLKIVVSGKTTNASDFDLGYIYFNGNSTGYTGRRLQGTGSAASSATQTQIQFRTTAANVTSVFGNAEIYIPNYTSSNNKSVSVDGVSEGNVTSTIQELQAALWSNTAAITQVTLYPNNGTWAQYTTATLYGIKSS